jgi:hypothetical protein
MRVISRRTLREYIDSKAGHRDQKSLKNALDAWFAEVQNANWKNTNDVKRNYIWASTPAVSSTLLTGCWRFPAVTVRYGRMSTSAEMPTVACRRRLMLMDKLRRRLRTSALLELFLRG